MTMVRMEVEASTPTATDNDCVLLPPRWPQPQLRLMDHTYRDYSTYFNEGGRLEKHKKCDRNFPACLHEILSNEQFSHIIAWMPHGRSWKVRDKKLLVKEVIPKYFGHKNYTSFSRQLNGWGFKMLRKIGPDNGSYYHECFLQGHPRLTVLMKRMNSGQGRAAPNSQEEPDFYVISKQFPLHSSESDKEPQVVYSCSKAMLDGREKESDTEIKSSPPEVMNFDFEPLPLSSHSIFDSAAMAATSRCETSVNLFQERAGNPYLGNAPHQDDTGHYTQPESIMAKHPTSTTLARWSDNPQDDFGLQYFKSLFDQEDDDDDSGQNDIDIISPTRTIQ